MNARPTSAAPRPDFAVRHYARPLVGALAVIAVMAVVVLAAAMFRGSFTKTVPATLISDRAGLVMNPDAKVKMLGVEVGRVGSMEPRPDGSVAVHLAMNPAKLKKIPRNVTADIASTTVFGAKYVQLRLPATPSSETMYAGQVLQGGAVTVEINTVFEKLNNVLRSIDPAKLNQTLGAISKAVNGRGEKMGQTIDDIDRFLATIEPSLPSLAHDIATLPRVMGTYASVAPDLMKITDNATEISTTIVDRQQDLDALLVSTLGLADLGNDVVTTNRKPLTELTRLLVPTTDLLDSYSPTLNCLLSGMKPFLKVPPLPVPGVLVSVGFTLGIERYRYPNDLPRVKATGGSNCEAVGLPTLAPGHIPPMVIADIGADPTQYQTTGILLNSAGLKQSLFGPIDGPPRNASQIGMPG